MVQCTWTPSSCPAEWQKDGGGWGTLLLSRGPAASEVGVGPVHRSLDNRGLLLTAGARPQVPSLHGVARERPQHPLEAG